MTHATKAAASETSRRVWHVEVTGTVQGVGFRPFVHRLATGLGLDGWVRNVDGHVMVAAAGSPAALEAFVAGVRRDAPPLAVVRTVRVGETAGEAPPPGTGFTVLGSAAPSHPGAVREIPPDAATCAACLQELFDPRERRYRYPFINCTDCGPRATVITDLPYDRERTTMRAFPLCPQCADEYRDPGDRRFHAEPLACPACGPRLSWQDSPTCGADCLGEQALRQAVAAIGMGRIVAVKGLGGYQLICDATNAAAVGELRRRKSRPAKPFAVMVRGLAAAECLARISRTERAALTSSARPVVLLVARPPASEPGPAAEVRPGDHPAQVAHAVDRVAPSVHPGTDRIGLFLPTTGLHHLLLRDLDRPLVVTSGNLAEEPLAIGDAEALDQLAGIADGFLAHDRVIHARHDDSVVHIADHQMLTIRRARGYAPAPLSLPRHTPVPLVASGAQLKHTFTLAAADRAVVAPHGGDLEDARTLDAFEASYTDLVRLTGIDPHTVVHDLHPGYLSTQWAAAHWPAHRRIAVQHHHAHVAACAAEHGVRGPFTGVAYDGLGLGDDGTLWGGEILVADLTGYRRVGRFATAALPGGSAAVRHPSRMALGYLHGGEVLGSPAPAPELTEPFTARLEQREAAAVRAMIARGVNCPRASSAGRLFDAVASLLGLGDEVSYEGQAAIALEAAAGDLKAKALTWRLVRRGGLWVYDPLPTLTALLEELAAKTAVPRLAAAFHTTLADVTAALVERAVAAGAPRTVCLSGGCLQNRRLLTGIGQALRAQGLRVLVGSAIPVNDGGISYGQAAVAAARLGKE
ncbi:carbamoyltransferase HypF [Streptomyces sp. HUAS TT7]|uniref:carbamoyltransferase HypF n=1 Tax=Streptomyces sp. HUAS TT7 TaxID=3447507 RepID=UPI003F65BBDB